MTLTPHVYKTARSSDSTREDFSSTLIENLITLGECLSVSAPNNFGKSYFLRQLLTTSAQTSHTNLCMVYIDCNLRADDSQQAFYELILKELLVVFKNNELEALYLELVANLTRSSFQVNHCFLVAFELVRNLLQRSGKKRLILVLDEFDQVILKFPPAVFRHLRPIKDRYQDGLAYVVGTNWPLLSLGREDEEDVAEFYELFDLTNLVRLKGLTRSESDKLSGAYLPDLSSEKLAWVYELAGGHPGLTLRLIQLLKAETATSFADLTALARLDPQLWLECRRIWNSLDQVERIALLQWLEGVRNLTIDPILGSLEERGVLKPVLQIKAKSSSGEIFARVFEWFLREKLEFEKAETVPDSFTNLASTFTSKSEDKTKLQGKNQEQAYLTSQLAFDPFHEVVIFDGGKTKRPLAGNAAILFKYLFLRQSIPYCSKDELISAVWGQEAAYSSENLDRLVSDLRQHIGDHNKQIIRTIPRRGLQMVGVAEWRATPHQPLVNTPTT